jgi:hypothetical protein
MEERVLSNSRVKQLRLDPDDNDEMPNFSLLERFFSATSHGFEHKENFIVSGIDVNSALPQSHLGSISLVFEGTFRIEM